MYSYTHFFLVFKRLQRHHQMSTNMSRDHKAKLLCRAGNQSYELWYLSPLGSDPGHFLAQNCA